LSDTPLELRGPRIGLRIPRADDAHRLFELASDAEVTRFFSWGPYEQESEAEDWLATLAPRRAAGIALELAVVDADDWVIGITGLLEISRRDRRAVVGTWLGQAYWGTGANAESKALIAHLAFGPLRMERLGAWADVRNPRSQRALERLGFVREGTLRAFHRHRDERRDVISYALLREEWASLELAAVSFTLIGDVPQEFVCDPRPPANASAPA
jgi:[ribosomal protein S5]-alanine N-acetyltransferase